MNDDHHETCQCEDCAAKKAAEQPHPKAATPDEFFALLVELESSATDLYRIQGIDPAPGTPDPDAADNRLYEARSAVIDAFEAVCAERDAALQRAAKAESVEGQLRAARDYADQHRRASRDHARKAEAERDAARAVLQLYRIKFAASDMGGWDAGAHLAAKDRLLAMGEPGIAFDDVRAALESLGEK